MIGNLFIGIVVLIALICGAKAGMFAAGKMLFNLFTAGYTSVMLLPVLRAHTRNFIPEEYREYHDSGLLAVSLIIILILLAVIWEKIREMNDRANQSQTMTEMPGLNRLFGAVYGALAGYFLAGILILIISALPLEKLNFSGQAESSGENTEKITEHSAAESDTINQNHRKQ